MTEDDKSEGRWEGRMEERMKQIERRMAWHDGKFWGVVAAYFSTVTAYIVSKLP